MSVLGHRAAKFMIMTMLLLYFIWLNWILDNRKSMNGGLNQKHCDFNGFEWILNVCMMETFDNHWWNGSCLLCNPFINSHPIRFEFEAITFSLHSRHVYYILYLLRIKPCGLVTILLDLFNLIFLIISVFFFFFYFELFTLLPVGFDLLAIINE